MYRIGQKEIDGVARVVNSGKAFRYGIGGECERFEQRYAKRLGAKYCVQTASGTHSLTAALIGLEIGPGDEVLVPACTYMASAMAVLAVGAIPVVVDIDESITISPQAVEDAIGPRTRAVMPVHMWGLPCNMHAIMRIARKRKIKVVEDACQAVGGGYEGKMLGAIGHIGAFSFNYYKNMSCGEGGAVVTNSLRAIRRARCATDPCSFYWHGRDPRNTGFAADGARASEFEGAMLNAQLDRIDSMIKAMRREKQRILKETLLPSLPLRAIPAHSLDWECGSHVMYQFDDEKAAARFAQASGGTVARNTGRHVYTEWDPVLKHHGAHHPALDPFQLPQNAKCRMDYSLDMCSPSLDILGRTVFIRTHPDHSRADTTALIRRIKDAAQHIETAD